MLSKQMLCRLRKPLRHHVSPEGFYRGRKVIDKGADE
mgnify:CR=1 FL=1